MATVASVIINKAKTVLLDSTNVRWTDAEHLNALNDGQREIAMMRPDLFAVTAAVLTVSGTKQTIPPAGLQLIKVTRSMGTDGLSPARVVRQVSMSAMDAIKPNWHSDTGSQVTLNYMFDPRSPKEYYIYPKSTGTHYLEIRYVSAPADVAAVGSNISVDDIFATALLDYILFRAYSKDQDMEGNTERAAAHRALFVAGVTGKASADVAVGGLNTLPQN